jgi:ectoine hydroxylase-related dioxygenase (phytanoyl-CoA dioxygenase family)
VLPHRHIDDDPAVQLLVADDADTSTAVPVPLPAGGCSFHHPRTLHHSRPNTGERERRAVANEFQTPPVRREVRADRPWHDEGRAALEAWAATAR